MQHMAYAMQHGGFRWRLRNTDDAFHAQQFLAGMFGQGFQE
jgi:hypothetical protein